MLTGSINTCTGFQDILTVHLEIINFSMIMLVLLETLCGSLNIVKVSQDMLTGHQDM
jgi:hypothetical protein